MAVSLDSHLSPIAHQRTEGPRHATIQELMPPEEPLERRAHDDATNIAMWSFLHRSQVRG